LPLFKKQLTSDGSIKYLTQWCALFLC